MAEYKNKIILCVSSIILKKNEGLQALPPLRPALQCWSAHILQSVFEDAGGLVHTAILPAQSSVAHWEPDLLLPWGLTGTSASVEAFCLPEGIYIKKNHYKCLTSGTFFSQRLQLLQMLSHNKWADQVSVMAVPENISQCSFTHWKTLQRAGSMWVTHWPCQHGWPALQPAPMAGTAGNRRGLLRGLILFFANMRRY